MIFKEKFDEIDTFEACYKDVFFNHKNLIIPYVNIGILKHPLNSTDKFQHVSFSYVACLNIAHVKFNGEVIFDNQNPKFGCYYFYYLGGINLVKQEGSEIEVLCKECFLQTTEKTQLSEDFWIPASRGSCKANMEYSEVENFFNPKNLPDNLKQLIA